MNHASYLLLVLKLLWRGSSSSSRVSYAVIASIMDIVPLPRMALKGRAKDAYHGHDGDCELLGHEAVVVAGGEVLDEAEERELGEGDAEDVEEG